MNVEIIEGTKLGFFQELYQNAKDKNADLMEKMERHLAQYKGSNKIDPSPGEGYAKDAKVVRNITYELIESQVTSYLPTPAVTAKNWSEKNERNAMAVETLLKNKRNELPFEVNNDIDERYNPIYGGSVWLVEWDESIITHNTVGDVKITCMSPSHFVGQPNIFSVDDMEYCFLTFETTTDDIVRKYGVSPKVAEDAADESSEGKGDDDDSTATLIVCYYKNEDDKVCQYIWSGDTELLDIDGYFSRKKRICKKCGKREHLCTCENPEFEEADEEYEELDHDIVRTDGSIIPAMSPIIKDGQYVMTEESRQALNPDGTVAMDNVNGVMLPAMINVQVPKTEKTKIPYYRPNILPVVIRKNTSQEDSLFGQSDCEFIRPQQQTINKIESRILEKLINGGVYPITPDNYEGNLDNTVYGHALKVKDPNQRQMYGTLDLQANIAQDIAEADRVYDHAKRILGITDSFQGQYDASAQSGKAKQIQVQQAAGRLDSKRQMKNAAYADMDKRVFQLFLAYADEPRPATYKDSQGRLQNRIFNRYDFVERDEAGEYYYNDDYLFSTDATVDIEKQKDYLWQENRLNFQSGAYGNPQSLEAVLVFWQNMESTHYPFAHDNVERIRVQLEQQQQMMAQQQQLAMAQAQGQQEIASHEQYEQYLKDRMKGARE